MTNTSNYIHNQPDWPNFYWDHETLATPLSKAKAERARLLGRVQSLGFEVRQDPVLKTITADEGDQVRESVARRLGMRSGGLVRFGRYIDGVGEMLLDATSKYEEPLTSRRLFGWHASLFPSHRSGIRTIRTGAYRDDAEGPIQVFSEDNGKRCVHFEGPEASKLEREMDAFLSWFDQTEDEWIITAALAHLWFVTIHPFDDGNGRIARAISDMSLARSEKSSQRFYSLSSQILKERASYDEILGATTQTSTMDVTPWLNWFIGCASRAVESSQATIANVLSEAVFLNANTDERQRLMVEASLRWLQ